MATAKKNTTPNPIDALAEARALADQREAEHEQAKEAADELFARLDRGDASVSGLDLATAEAEIKRTEHLLSMARKQIPAAERAVKLYEGQTNPVLAEYLRAIIEEHRFNFGLFGVPIEVVPQRPEKLTAPAAYLYQVEGADYDTTTGHMTGTAHLLVTVPADGLDTIREACTTGIYKLVHHAGHAEVRDSLVMQPDHFVLSVYLKNLEPPMPVISERSTATGTTLAQRLGGLAALRSKQWIDDPRTGRMANTHTIMSGKHAGEVVSQARDGDTVRRKVRVQFTVHGIDRNIDFPELATFVDRAIEDVKGTFSAGLGRVESAKVTSREPAKVNAEVRAVISGGTIARPALAVTAELILISKAAA
ncbi:hypothetical protein [Micromonospora coerulea]|uniref:hypothetical protein n=1 Tax=Micromonospora coerulea TaxID=47856 RepID=UPI001907BCFC|nr:hypothetical protein [Micromonospora veneta]